jgi:hypothetical protein
MPTYTGRIFSPRWGHEDTYEFQFEEDRLTISHLPRTATCTWRENLDPLWEGEALERMLTNDSIYPPAVFRSLIEHLWKSWRNSDIRQDDVDAELQAVVTWLNATTMAKPRTEFWRKYF